MKYQSIDTIAVHGGHTPDPVTGARAVPIYQTTAYQFKDADHAARLFDLAEPGYIYTRLNNPTVEVLENRMSMLEGGTGAVATSSGQFAEFMVFTSIAEAGDEIITTNRLYGGTNNLFFSTFKKLGIKFIGIDHDDFEAIEGAITDKTKGIYLETVSNPGNDIPNMEKVAEIAHRNGLPLIVDNTYPTPYLCRPKDFGADVVIHSVTKFLGGHGNSMGGVAVDLGTFDWAASGRFPGFTEPDPSYHGVVYSETFGNMALAVKMRVQIMRDIGGCMTPMNAFLLLQGIETLHLRMERHVENAGRVARFLEGHPAVERVSYPDLDGNKNAERLKKYLPKGSGAMLSFELKGGYESGKAFIEGVELATHLTNLGDTRTLVTHPASTTHRQLSTEQKQAAGIGEGLIRMSIGIEGSEDILADLEQALAKAEQV
ncbi:O-acetylhomoserine aminocarboxypropyltransferase/cysteine synthase family protein [Limisalsivibrio acetivorans]|uniref:O-acetylhomoserine aminocarboxypropyltransferase/cysteine synthase family protein n=1 Tax=Limisalsivibrio acetivorans TaxID=1304888 RepID=UPI0003B53DA8|nr:O-acetylhomoserine aminocarboxypropyltransferase/cysteine synthase family protein [Limisalsivibrio acetivorans]